MNKTIQNLNNYTSFIRYQKYHYYDTINQAYNEHFEEEDSTTLSTSTRSVDIPYDTCKKALDLYLAYGTTRYWVK